MIYRPSLWARVSRNTICSRFIFKYSQWARRSPAARLAVSRSRVVLRVVPWFTVNDSWLFSWSAVAFVFALVCFLLLLLVYTQWGCLVDAESSCWSFHILRYSIDRSSSWSGSGVTYMIILELLVVSSRIHVVGVPGWRCVVLLIFPLLAVYYNSLIVFIRIWNGLRTYRCILLVVFSRIHAVSVDAVSLPWYCHDLLFTIAHSSSLSGVASYTPCWLLCIHNRLES